MNYLDMCYAVADAISHGESCGIILTFKKGSKPKTFPKGELLNEMERNGVVELTYRFPHPRKILLWLVKNGFV